MHTPTWRWLATISEPGRLMPAAGRSTVRLAASRGIDQGLQVALVLEPEDGSGFTDVTRPPISARRTAFSSPSRPSPSCPPPPAS